MHSKAKISTKGLHCKFFSLQIAFPGEWMGLKTANVQKARPSKHEMRIMQTSAKSVNNPNTSWYGKYGQKHQTTNQHACQALQPERKGKHECKYIISNQIVKKHPYSICEQSCEASSHPSSCRESFRIEEKENQRPRQSADDAAES